MFIPDRSRFVVVLGIVVGCGPTPEVPSIDAVSTQSSSNSTVVISQLYGGGGNSGAPFATDFVELFNRGTASVAIDGWSVQYASSNGSSWAKANLSGTIPAGGYYLVQLAGGTSGGASLPAPDATGTMNMSGTSGTIALVDDQSLLACGGSTGACLPNADIRDFVGYGSASQFEGSGAAPTVSTATAGLRAGNGCIDSDNNQTDFATINPEPRNSAAPHAPCSTASDAGVVDAPPPHDGAVDGSPPVDAPDSGDGPPTRKPCTSSFGSHMSTAFGRLDGFLVAIVNPGSSGCASDSGHVHLQVEMNGQIYNIAVDVVSTGGGSSQISFDHFVAIDKPLIGGPWSEGWHTSGEKLDYVSNLGLHSTNFAATPKSQMVTFLGNALATVNHVSIFTTGFNSSGGHLVHREGSNHDGAIVIEPLSANPEYLLFRFPEQSF